MKTILHLDMDSYFASVEQQYNQKLVGKPVGVIKALGRSCIIAASHEAKKFGVKTGTPVWEAKKLCPQIIFVPADFDKYFKITKSFIKICENFSPYLEVFSTDELFLDVTLTKPLFGGAYKMVEKIKNKIRKEIGEHITCSVGISYNRLLAKLASGMNKPNGVFEINHDNRDEVLFKVELSDLCGIGERIKRRLFKMGVKNLKSLRMLAFPFLKAEFGPHLSLVLKNFSYGEDSTGLNTWETIDDPKSVSRTFTLFKDTNDEKIIRRTLRNLCEEVAYKLRKLKMQTRQIGLGIRGDGIGDFVHKTYETYTTNSGLEIFKNAWDLYENLGWQKNVRFLGVWAGLLDKDKNLTFSCFPEIFKKEKLEIAVDKINDKFGGFTVCPAVLLGGELIRPEVNGFLGDKHFLFLDKKSFSPNKLADARFFSE